MKKDNIKRKMSLITIMLFSFVFVTILGLVSNIIFNKTLCVSYRDDEFVSINVLPDGIDNITDKIDDKLKNLNIEARSKDTNEFVSKFSFSKIQGKYYVYTSDKTYAEIKDCNIFTELEDIENYIVKNNYRYSSRIDYINATSNYYNISKSKWENKLNMSSNNPNVNIHYEERKNDNIVEKRIKFNSNIMLNLSKEFYENIIIYQGGNGGGKCVFDRIEGDEYIYKGTEIEKYEFINCFGISEVALTNEYDIYIPNIYNNLEIIVDNSKELNTVYESEEENYKVYSGVKQGDYIEIGKYEKQDRIKTEFEWIDENRGKINFLYSAEKSNSITMCGGSNLTYPKNEEYRYNITEKSGRFSDGSNSFIIFKEKLPENFKLSDEYLNNSKWLFLNNSTTSTNSYISCISNDVINAFMSDVRYQNFKFTNKKYLYDRGSNTIYYIVDEINKNGREEINIEYIGDENSNRKYSSSEGAYAWYIVLGYDTLKCEQNMRNIYINEYSSRNITVDKKWEDNNNENKKRPDSIIVQLKINDSIQKQIELNDENNWKYTFNNVFSEYKLIEKKYEINSVLQEVDNKSSIENFEYTVDEENTKSPLYVKEVNGTTITNRFVVPDDRIKIVGKKIWDDNENSSGKRPQSVILQVKENGNVITEAEVSEKTNWSYEFELVKYDEKGNERKYQIDEKYTNESYEKELLDETTVLNRFKVPDEKIEIEVDKKWLDENNKDKIRPESIMLQIKVGEKIIDEAEVSKDCEWKHKFILPKYDKEGREIKYIIDEREVNSGDLKYYEKSIDKNTIINTSIYKSSTDTSDINIGEYILIAVIAIVMIIGSIFSINKINRNNNV